MCIPVQLVTGTRLSSGFFVDMLAGQVSLDDPPFAAGIKRPDLLCRVLQILRELKDRSARISDTVTILPAVFPQEGKRTFRS